MDSCGMFIQRRRPDQGSHQRPHLREGHHHAGQRDRSETDRTDSHVRAAELSDSLFQRAAVERRRTVRGRLNGDRQASVW